MSVFWRLDWNSANEGDAAHTPDRWSGQLHEIETGRIFPAVGRAAAPHDLVVARGSEIIVQRRDLLTRDVVYADGSRG